MRKRTIYQALLVSLVSTGSLFLIELAYSDGFPLGVSSGVFWFLGNMSFIGALSILEGLSRKPINKFVRLGTILTGVFAVFAWLIMFIDQLPCFFGGKGC
jgi:hypothetical protein